MSRDLLPKTCLLLIDIQRGFNHPTHWGSSRSTPKFEDNIARLLKAFREFEPGHQLRPTIFHVYHSSLIPGSPLHPNSGDGMDFMPYAAPTDGESVISKNVNSAFIGTNLEGLLRNHDIRQLVICGLTTDHCVSTSTRMAANLRVTDHTRTDGSVDHGKVILIEDATATHNRERWDAETIHSVSLASLRDEFAQIMTTEELLTALF